MIWLGPGEDFYTCLPGLDPLRANHLQILPSPCLAKPGIGHLISGLFFLIFSKRIYSAAVKLRMILAKSGGSLLQVK